MKTLTDILVEHQRSITDHDVCTCGKWTYYSPDSPRHAAHVAAAYRQARTITTEADLTALHKHHPGPPSMSGVLIKESLYGDVFETCDDGTWENIGNPESDAPPILPALVLWLPEEA